MSDWSKFKTIKREEPKDSKMGLVFAMISLGVLGGAVGGGVGLSIVLYIANSEDHKASIVFAESHNVLPIEVIYSIIGGGAFLGFIVGLVAGGFMFLPEVFRPNQVSKPAVDDPFDDDMSAT